jgi:ABC-2 type transport system ATP-binding protein
VRTVGTPDELKEAIAPDATLEDVFRRFTGETLAGAGAKGGLREIRRTRRTARRVG